MSIRSNWLQLIYDAGQISVEIDRLQELEVRGQEKIVVGQGKVPRWKIIKQHEEKLRNLLDEIQKGYKTSGL